MEREKITLRGAPETMLATLYGKALDSRAPNPILGDREAERAVERIDYDFRKTGVNDAVGSSVALRSKQLDDWTREFLSRNPEATVLHLACGLDTRVHRIAPPPTVRWVDVDLPEVIDLRRRLLSEPAGDYRVVPASVTDPDWLDEVPADRPTVTVFEGLSMYLREEEGLRLIQRITGRFSRGELLFDCFGTMGIKIQKLVPAVRNAGATLHWGIDDPYALESLHPGLKCVDDLRSVDTPGLERLPASTRVAMWVMARLPGFRDIGRMLRYRY